MKIQQNIELYREGGAKRLGSPSTDKWKARLLSHDVATGRINRFDVAFTQLYFYFYVL